MRVQPERRNLCDNQNHRRADAPVRNCPSCGDVVNERVRARQCSDGAHAAARKDRNVFCVDCGTRLMSEN